MASFYPALVRLKELLETGLSTFCSERWQRLPTVSISFKVRKEITLDELPLVFITRPQKENDQEIIGTAQNSHTVTLYVGFQEEDRALALQYIVEMEECIDGIIRSNFDLSGLVEEIVPVNSVNDEGNFHPVYFQAIELKAIHHT